MIMNAVSLGSIFAVSWAMAELAKPVANDAGTRRGSSGKFRILMNRRISVPSDAQSDHDGANVVATLAKSHTSPMPIA